MRGFLMGGLGLVLSLITGAMVDAVFPGANLNGLGFIGLLWYSIWAVVAVLIVVRLDIFD